ncbi:hypothetical protein PG994_015130 [Apiospora phragmitis]|uniref:Uncharacterized protein n=1 Tax=Apiospora phragmitis TaxID=2905665 RepID=A0ABR1SVM6_9PEZI
MTYCNPNYCSSNGSYENQPTTLDEYLRNCHTYLYKNFNLTNNQEVIRTNYGFGDLRFGDNSREITRASGGTPLPKRSGPGQRRASAAKDRTEQTGSIRVEVETSTNEPGRSWASNAT